MTAKKFILTPNQVIFIVVGIIVILIALYYIYTRFVEKANPPTENKPSTTASAEAENSGEINEGEAILTATNIKEIDNKTDIARTFNQTKIKNIAKIIQTASPEQLKLIAVKLNSAVTQKSGIKAVLELYTNWGLFGCNADTKAEHNKMRVKLSNL